MHVRNDHYSATCSLRAVRTLYVFRAGGLKVVELKTRYTTEEETERKIRILLTTAFLPGAQPDADVSLLEASITVFNLVIRMEKRKKIKMQMAPYKIHRRHEADQKKTTG
ncbi:hypothetical protein T4B_10677, partial [Trichinella pseudospiralis]